MARLLRGWVEVAAEVEIGGEGDLTAEARGHVGAHRRERGLVLLLHPRHLSLELPPLLAELLGQPRLPRLAACNV